MRLHFGFVLVLSGAVSAGAETTAEAPRSDRYFGLRGVGSTSCEDYLRLEVHEEMRDAVMSWTYGYWSGLNIALNYDESKPSIEKNLFDQSVGPDELAARVKARCIEDRSDNVMGIISDIYWDLPDEPSK